MAPGPGRWLFGSCADPRGWAVLAWLLAAGCTSSDGADAGAVPQTRAPAGSLALLQLERFSDTDEAGPRMVAGAKIARYNAIESDALLRLLGADGKDLESCSAAPARRELELKPEAHVELLSVGDIVIRGGDVESVLSPRLFPALATTASGWFYAGDAELGAPLAEFDEYVVSARGERGVGGFELALGAPPKVSGLTLAGAVEGQPLDLDRSHDAEVLWEAEDPGDRVELELFAGGGALSCAARDDGKFTLTPAQLADLEADENAFFVVRRVRVVPVDMHGIDAAYARIATTRTFAVHVR